MDIERLKKLKERTERASALANDIETLMNASPIDMAWKELVFRDKSTNTHKLAGDMLDDVVERGRLALLADKETEIASLLAAEVESPTMRTCENCNGTGTYTHILHEGAVGGFDENATCVHCAGTGQVRVNA